MAKKQQQQRRNNSEGSIVQLPNGNYKATKGKTHNGTEAVTTKT